jgi:adenosine kinase
MKTIVTGSIAYDYLMSFPGEFTEHFLPDHLNRVSLSFLVDSMDKRRGGCAPNIAYSLALLGERPFVKIVPGKFTASFFCSTDQKNNQIASFYTGAMAHAAELSFRTVRDAGLVIISPNDPAAMTQYAEECRALGIRFIFDPGQQCARMSGDELKDGISGAAVLICNDYEFELIRQKTGLSESDVLAGAEALVITKGEKGSSVLLKDGQIEVPAVAPSREADPTGVGDAYRGGLMRGMQLGLDWETCARLGSVAATYALEHLGGTAHAYTLGEFRQRYAKHFGKAPL